MSKGNVNIAKEIINHRIDMLLDIVEKEESFLKKFLEQFKEFTNSIFVEDLPIEKQNLYMEVLGKFMLIILTNITLVMDKGNKNNSFEAYISNN